MTTKNDFNSIQYDTSFKAEISEENGKKSVLISGILMNDKMNANFWKLPAEELISIAQQFAGHPIKVQHSGSDWEIIGKGVSAYVQGSEIRYTAKITDTDAVDKFVSTTWTADNMGISPAVQPTSIECSICGKDPSVYGEDSCPHIIGEEYSGAIAGVITRGNKLTESSLTSRPAYEDVGAGSIEDANLQVMVASIQKVTKMEEKRMAGKTEIETKVEELTALKAELKTSKVELKASQDEVSQMKEEIKKAEKAAKEAATKLKKDEDSGVVEATIAKLKEDLEAAQTVIVGYKKEARTAELTEIVSDEDFVAEILAKEMSDEEFTAEIAKIKKIKELSATTVETNGSAPLEAGKPADKDMFAETFGSSQEEMTASIFGEIGKKE